VFQAREAFAAEIDARSHWRAGQALLVSSPSVGAPLERQSGADQQCELAQKKWKRRRDRGGFPPRSVAAGSGFPFAATSASIVSVQILDAAGTTSTRRRVDPPTMISPACVTGSITETVALGPPAGCGYVDDSLETAAPLDHVVRCFLNIPVPSSDACQSDDDDGSGRAGERQKSDLSAATCVGLMPEYDSI